MNSVQRTPEARSGLFFAFGAYILWGLLPLYFALLTAVNGFEITAWRVLLTVIVCAILLTVMRGWPALKIVLHDRGSLYRLAIAAVLIFANWTVYVVTATSGNVLETSLGYFVNPVVTILLGVFFLGEKLSVAQWAAVGMTVIAFIVIAVGYGAVPWAALTLAFSFGLYGFVKKKVGGRVGPVQGLAVETVFALPLAVIVLIAVQLTGGLTAFRADAGTVTLLMFAGVATAVPLLLFAAAASRLPLTVLGFCQYIAPSMMFLLGWLAFGEPMPLARWLGFGLVWLSLVIVSIDSVRRSRRPGTPVEAAPATGPIVLGKSED